MTVTRCASGIQDRALRVAVVGSGIGRAHLTAYRGLPNLFEIAAVCDIDRDRAVGLAETFAVPHRRPCVVSSLDELCRMDRAGCH